MNGLNELKGFLFEGANEQPSVIVYAPKITPRLRYVCKFIFNQGLLINFILIDNENEFLQSKLPKINYSVLTFEKALNVNPSGLLNETTLQDKETDFKDDIFSNVFYHISRYEEWINTKTDTHGRFTPEKVNEIPVVDVLIQEFKKEFKSISFPERKFKFISTIDVDNVYAYKAKPLYRKIGGMLKDLLRLNLIAVGERVNTIVGSEDPFDAYALQTDLSKKYNIPLIYFFLYRNKSKYDRTIDPNHPEFLKLLRLLNDRNITIGLHPSYDSLVDSSLLNNELTLLTKNAQQEIICSRQHYLRFNIKTTPKDLINAGIKFDFTMGFADKCGFRAGTTLPFYYFDFETESELNLLAVPFTAMDGAFYIYNNTGATPAFNELMNLAVRIKAVNGLFITVIHDRSFSDAIAPGWRYLYLKLHENLKS